MSAARAAPVSAPTASIARKALPGLVALTDASPGTGVSHGVPEEAISTHAGRPCPANRPGFVWTDGEDAVGLCLISPGKYGPFSRTANVTVRATRAARAHHAVRVVSDGPSRCARPARGSGRSRRAA